MKIGIIIYSLKIDYGGVEISISNLARYFQKQKRWSVEIIPLRETSWSSIIRLFFQKKYDFVIGGLHYRPYYLAILLAKLQKIKSILFVTNPLSFQLQQQKLAKRPLSRFFTSLALKLSNRIICVSRGVAYDLKHNFQIPPRKLTIIYNGIDCTTIQKTAQQPLPKHYHSLLQNNDVIVSCGRLVSSKRFDVLIRAFQEINHKLPATKLLILGDGPQKKNLQRLVQQLGLEKEVYLPGFVKNPYAFFSKSKLFLLASAYEGFCNAIVEAMFCGLPVVSADCPYGPREILAPDRISFPFTPTKKIVKGQFGILTPPGDKEAIARAALNILQNKTLAAHYSQAGLKRAQNFSLEKMGGKYSHLISAMR